MIKTDVFRKLQRISLLCALAGSSGWIIFQAKVIETELFQGAEGATRRPRGHAQLVAKERFPFSAETCELLPASAAGSLIESLQDGLASPTGQSSLANGPVRLDRLPARMIRDTDPIYSSITVDTTTDEVILYDANLFGISVFSRLSNTSSSAAPTKPKRQIAGAGTEWPNKSGMQFNNGLYVDPKTGDIFSAEADIGDSISVFRRGAEGDVAPTRVIDTPHRAYAMAADEEKDELYLAVQYPPSVFVYRKTASGNEQPLRVIQGSKTGFKDIQGIAVDVRNRLLIVTNYGNHSTFNVPGSGRFYPPSISIHSLDATGDASPLRVIQGPKTQLNWPAQLSVDPTRGEIYVANNAGSSLLVFGESDQGDVLPRRQIKGPKTGLKSPTGVFADIKNNEVWASNMGNSSARVFPLNANGDVPPLRIIRSAPEGKVSLKFSKPGAVAYDSRREEVLAPN
jgi:hypothetical protein